jgi:adenylate kinase family enzyme
MNSIIFLSGPVGAGKTTVARQLVAISPPPVAYIEGDAFWPIIAKSTPDKSRLDHFKTILRAMTRAASAFARDGYEVIVDFSTPPGFVDALPAKMPETTIDYVVLFPSQAVCAERAANRAQGVILDYAPYMALYSAFEEGEGFMIRNDDLNPADAAARIREGLNTGKYRIPRG